MTKFLLSLHVVAAILAIGPVTVAASMFPRSARAALAEPADPRATASVGTLHRITRVYAILGIFVPAFGLATAMRLGVLGDGWLLSSIALTALAAAVLIGAVLPGQRRLLGRIEAARAAGADPDPADGRRQAGMLGAVSGVFASLWVVVTVLMIVRPGSTTGA
ncbi:DUF2269 family protein [Micromonospora sp. 067-2]|uniref:DUF2269 family protein n=1 Tax=Micromonospora sp. 067-2 TaxID=2789270 RepID=UPI00397E45F4